MRRSVAGALVAAGVVLVAGTGTAVWMLGPHASASAGPGVAAAPGAATGPGSPGGGTGGNGASHARSGGASGAAHAARLLFTRAGAGLEIVDLATGRVSPVGIGGAFGTSQGRGVWSPDGTMIAFQSNASKGNHIEVGRVGGSGLTDLTPLPADAVNVEPAWAPDGRAVAFASSRGGGRLSIWTARLSDRKLTQLTDGTTHDAFPAWSPDGRQIAFVRTVGDHPSTASASLMLMNADGSGAHVLVALAQAAVTVEPSWSPDGRLLAFADGAPDAMQIFTITPSGQSRTQVSHDAGGHYDPAWSPDGTLIAFARFTSPGTGIWVMRADGTHLRQVTDATKGPLPDPQGRLDGQPGWQP